MKDSTWIGRELRPNDRSALARVVEGAPRPAALFVKAAHARGEDFPGWWFGAWRDGQTLEAVMAVENHQGVIYAQNDEAARGLGQELYASQKRMGPTIQSHRHQLLAESKTMGIIWPIVKDIPGRKLLFDKESELLEGHADDTAAPSSRVTCDTAQRADERVVHDFVAELRIEQLGIDPRKTGRDTHAQRIIDAIAYGRVLIAKEKDSARPFFVAELLPLDASTVQLTDVYVPPHYRSRGKLIAQAFWAAARHPLAAGKELVYLAADSTLSAAAKSAGWKRVAGYRWTATHG